MEEKRTTRIPVSATLSRYAKAARAYPWLLSGVLGSAFVLQVVELSAPLALREFVNLLSLDDRSPAILDALFITLGVVAALVFLRWSVARFHFWCITYIDARVMRDLYERAFEYLIRHSYRFFSNQFAGSLTRKVGRYSKSFETIFDGIVMQLFPAAFFISGAAIVLYLRNETLGIAFISWVVVFLAVQIALIRRNNPLRAKRAEEDSRLTGALADTIGNQNTVAVFAGERHEDSRLRSTVARWYQAIIRIWNADEFAWGVQGFLMMLVNIGLLYGALHYWTLGMLTLGDFVLIQAYLLTTFERLYAVNREVRSFSEAFADAGEMVEILETPHEVVDRPGATSLQVPEGQIEFKKVDFHFTPEQPVLKDFSLSIAPGEKVALVGPSGAGKTTITKLLLRLYDVKDGTITIDGTDIRSITQESLRESISFVPQEPILFHRTLMDNIRYGKRDATDEEVKRAAKEAHCLEFIAKTRHGFQTYVGERGVKLSGGERQRIAIARAILKDAPILVLDEATSALDSENEALIQDALARLMKGKTVIAIAHRLSTVMKMDRIVVIEEGSVVTSGTHDELVRHEGGLYKKLWEIQAGGFIADDLSRG